MMKNVREVTLKFLLYYIRSLFFLKKILIEVWYKEKDTCITFKTQYLSYLAIFPLFPNLHGWMNKWVEQKFYFLKVSFYAIE